MVNKNEFRESGLVGTLKEILVKKLGRNIFFANISLGHTNISSEDPEVIKLYESGIINIEDIDRAVHYRICDEVRKKYDLIKKRKTKINIEGMTYEKRVLAHAFRHGDFTRDELKSIQFARGQDYYIFRANYYQGTKFLREATISLLSQNR